MKSKGADPITPKDIQSVKTYRSALNRELIQRRAGKYSQAWLAERLSICIRTLQRYVKLDDIQCQQIFYSTDITPNNIHQIPPKGHAKQAGISIQHCFPQDIAGKRYPPLLAIAQKLMRRRIPFCWIKRGVNIYWIDNDQIKIPCPYLVFLSNIEHDYIKA